MGLPLGAKGVRTTTKLDRPGRWRTACTGWSGIGLGYARKGMHVHMCVRVRIRDRDRIRVRIRVRVRLRVGLQDGGGAVAAADYGVGVILGERGEHLLDEL